MESVNLGAGALEERSGLVHYRGGSHATLNWFKPVWHAWLGTGLGWGQERAGNQIQLESAPAGATPGPTTRASATCGATTPG